MQSTQDACPVAGWLVSCGQASHCGDPGNAENVPAAQSRQENAALMF